MMTPIEMRKKAIRELFALFNKPPTEENIAYMMGLYTAGVDTVGLAIGLIGPEYEQMFPSEPGNDVQMDIEDYLESRKK